MRGTLLVVGGGVEAVPGIERLRALGFRIVVSDADPNAPGLRAADAGVVASTYDVEATVEAARELRRREPLHGVLCIAADVPLTVASVAAALGLRGISVAAARLASDKLALKRALARHEVPSPWFRPIGSADELEACLRERGPQLVVKPADSRGARGVVRLGSGVDSAWAFGFARAHSPTGRVLVEEFVGGPQISTESFLLRGRVHTMGFADRNYDTLERLAPFVIENGGEQPSRHALRWQDAVDRLIGRAARALGIEEGSIKGDLVIDPERGPMVIELAARLSGGHFSTDTIPLSTGVDLIGLAGRWAAGESVEVEIPPVERWRPVANRYFLPPPGRLRAIRGVEEVRRWPGIHRVELTVHPGEWLEPITDHTRRAGSVIATGRTREEAVTRAIRAVEAVRFDVEAAPEKSGGETDAASSRVRPRPVAPRA